MRVKLFFAIFSLCIPGVAQHMLVDKEATNETKVLYDNLYKLKDKGFIFGHQDDLAYGVQWKYQEGKSDVKEVTGDYPGIYGWDLGGIEKKAANNLDGVPFIKMKKYIQQIHEKGGVITLSWHVDNPFTGKNAWDTAPNSLASVLPNGSKHALYKSWLDNAVRFIKSLKDKNGKPIPILYRPYHELTGNWFWWTKNNATPQQFTQLWKFTVNYFKAKGIHNFIYVYNTSAVDTKQSFLEYYPGTDYADILSFDNYQYNDPAKDDSFVLASQKMFAIMDEVGKEQNKLIAFAETGYEAIPYQKWWTDTLMKAIGDYKISYVLAWRNHGWQEKEKKMHYYVPYKGQVSEQDFINFYNLSNTFFQKDVTKASLYNKSINN